MAIENDALVEAFHQRTGERREVPEHWLGKGSPFPGEWGKTAPSAAEQKAAEKAAAANAPKEA